MAQYTIEDIEILRQKSGISYEEAVNLLEYHNGSLARALVDLEKNGRIRDSKTAANAERHSGRGHNFFNTLYRTRIRVYRGDITIINISVLFVIFTVFVAVWVPIIGAIVALVLGYRITLERNSRDFATDTLENMVRHAGSNVRNTVYTFARDFSAKPQGNAGETQPVRNAESEARTESPASGTTPVNVQFSEEGSIRVTENRDGYHEADIQ